MAVGHVNEYERQERERVQRRMDDTPEEHAAQRRGVAPQSGEQFRNSVDSNGEEVQKRGRVLRDGVQ